jgi:hypothetical protein
MQFWFKIVFTKVIISSLCLFGVLLYSNVLMIICIISFSGMLVYMFVMSKEHNFVLFCMVISFRLSMSLLEFRKLNALGSGIASFSSFVRCEASLHPGLFFQLTIALMGSFSLCSFIVPSMRGVSGFKFTYFHFSVCFIVLLHVLMVPLIAFCCVLVRSLVVISKLLLDIKSLIVWLYLFFQSYYLI